MRFPIDALQLLTVFGVLSLQLWACIDEWPWIYAVIPILLGRQVNAVQHNLAHLRIFRSRRLNELLGWLCFLSIGVPLEFYEHHHVKHHHKYNNRFDDDGKDYSSMYGFAGTSFPEKPIGIVYYVLTFPALTISHCLIDILRRPGSRLQKRFTVSLCVVLASCVALFTLFGADFFVFFGLTWLAMFHGLGLATYLQHHGCDFSTPFHSSKNQINLFGILGFNVGYHISHHMKPMLHWSQLPAHSESIKHNFPPDSER